MQSGEDCRAVQDKIWQFASPTRISPTWLDQLRRPHSEAATQLTAWHLIEEATAHSQVSPNSE